MTKVGTITSSSACLARTVSQYGFLWSNTCVHGFFPPGVAVSFWQPWIMSWQIQDNQPVWESPVLSKGWWQAYEQPIRLWASIIEVRFSHKSEKNKIKKNSAARHMWTRESLTKGTACEKGREKEGKWDSMRETLGARNPRRAKGTRQGENGNIFLCSLLSARARPGGAGPGVQVGASAGHSWLGCSLPKAAAVACFRQIHTLTTGSRQGAASCD